MPYTIPMDAPDIKKVDTTFYGLPLLVNSCADWLLAGRLFNLLWKVDRPALPTHRTV